MSSNVYPFVFSYKTLSARRDTRTQIVLLDTTRSRKGDWVIRAKDGWDESWATVVNVDQTFGHFLTLSRVETKVFQGIKSKQEGKKVPFQVSRELEGGKLGYSRNTFFWNVLRWSFVTALVDGYVSSVENYIYSLKLEEKLHDLPTPVEIEGKERSKLTTLPESLQWQYAGLDYHFDYLKRLEKILKPIEFKILTHF